MPDNEDRGREQRPLAYDLLHRDDEGQPVAWHRLGGLRHRDQVRRKPGVAWTDLGPNRITGEKDLWQGAAGTTVAANVLSILVRDEPGLQVTRFTVTAALPDAIYELRVNGILVGMVTGAAPTTGAIAARLAEFIADRTGLRGVVTASASGAVVTVTAIRAGTPFTLVLISADLALGATEEATEDILIGLREGGVWRRIHGRWLSCGDRLASGSIRALAESPTEPSEGKGQGALYAAVGSHSETYTDADTRASGLWRSAVGGLRWNPVDGGLGVSGLGAEGISAVVCPRPRVVVVGTSAGLYLSADGGHHFGTPPACVDGKPVREGRVLQLKLDTQPPYERVYAGILGQGIVELTLSPTLAPTWRVLLDRPAAYNFVFDQFTAPPKEDWFLVLIAQGPTKLEGLYVFDRKGGGPIELDLPVVTREPAEPHSLHQAQLWYTMVVGVDPQDSSTIYVGTTNLLRSKLLGFKGSWTDISTNQIHGDQQTLAFDPRSRRNGVPTRLYVGNDGGLYRSDDCGKTWTSLNDGIGASLVYDLATNPARPEQVVVGLQDCGTLARRNGDGNARPWLRWGGGDGGDVVAGPAAGSAVGLVTDKGLVVTADDGAHAQVLPVQRDQKPVATHALSTQLALGPAGELFLAHEDTVYRAGPAPWAGAVPAVKLVGFGCLSSPPVTALRYDPAGDRLWVGFGTGGEVVSMKPDGSDRRSFQPVDTARPITAIAVDPRDARTVAVSYGGYALAHPRVPCRAVYLTTDGGKTWKDVSGQPDHDTTNLPDTPVYDLVWDDGANPATLYAATDVGVFECTARKGEWALLGASSPPVPVRALSFVGGASGSLRAGTFGRGVWERKAGLEQLVEMPSTDDLVAAPGTTARYLLRLENVADGPVTVWEIDVMGEAFSLDPSFTLPRTVAGGQRLEVPLLFAPTRAGAFSAVVQDAGRTFLAGVGGLSLPLTPQPRLVVGTGSAFGFGRLTRGESKTLPLVLSSTGEKPLTITAVKLGSDFSITGLPPLPHTLAPGASLDLGVTYKAAWGPDRRFLEVQSDDPAGGRFRLVHGSAARFPWGWIVLGCVLGTAVAATIAVAVHEGNKAKSPSPSPA